MNINEAVSIHSRTIKDFLIFSNLETVCFDQKILVETGFY